MIAAMDLNALPEEDEENVEPQTEQYSSPVEHFESGADIEREERRKRLKRDHDRPSFISQPPHDLYCQTRNVKPYDRNRIPPGWLDCPSYGKEICRIIPSKVPLSEQYNDHVPPGKRYSFKQVLKSFGRKLGLVVDLTNTTRYYPTSDLRKEGIKHLKIPCKGRDAVPDNASVNTFVYEVTQFLNHQKHSKKCILVHCTHGHNRTGYMIVHYLMRTQPSMTVTQAIKTFADARPPGIYKADYIEALYSFYHERKPELVICPSIPDWKWSTELDLNGEAVLDEDDDGGQTVPFQGSHETDVIMSNDDILGDEIPQEQLHLFRRFCYQTLKLNATGRGMTQFPGSHPVSLNRDNLQLLRQRYYYATWKADGTRYMMLITTDGCYLIDRTFNFRRVQMRFPCRQTNDGFSRVTHHYTLLDGEMIIDKLPDSSKQERRYLIYDLMAINGMPVIERPFSERWKMLEKEVIEPRNLERQLIRNPYYRYDLEPFREEEFLVAVYCKQASERIHSKLSHDADGLIFQGWDDPYVPRTHEGLLKWKYPEMNSVDFLFEINDDGLQQLFLHERGKKKLLEGNRVTFKAMMGSMPKASEHEVMNVYAADDHTDNILILDRDVSPSSYSGKIIECTWDSDAHVWLCMRIRPDKSTPNDFNTYKKVMESIKDNITEDVLLNEIYEIICLPMYADRILSDCKARQHNNSARRRR